MEWVAHEGEPVRSPSRGPMAASEAAVCRWHLCHEPSSRLQLRETGRAASAVSAHPAAPPEQRAQRRRARLLDEWRVERDARGVGAAGDVPLARARPSPARPAKRAQCERRREGGSLPLAERIELASWKWAQRAAVERVLPCHQAPEPGHAASRRRHEDPADRVERRTARHHTIDVTGVEVAAGVRVPVLEDRLMRLTDRVDHNSDRVRQDGARPRMARSS